jgi:restriction endonuclease S subunit
LNSLAAVSDGNHLTISNQFSDEGVRYLRGQDLNDFFVSDSNAVYIPEEAYDKLKRSHMFPGDVLLSIVGTIGNVALVTEQYTKLTGSCKIAIIRPHSISPYFLAIYFASKIGQDQIARRVRGAVQQGVILPDLKEFPIPVVSDDQENEIERLVIATQQKRNEAKSLYAQAEALLLHELGLDTLDLSHQTTFTATFAEVMEARRLDAEYFQPKYQRAMQLMSKSGQHIGDIASLSKQRFKPDKNKDFQYIEIGDITSDGLAMNDTIEGADAPSRAQWVVSPGDVITSTVRPIRRLTALIEDHQKGYVCSSGFAVLEPQQIPGELLMTYLRLPIVCEILDLHTTASMYPAISTQDLMKIPITMPSKEAQQKVVEQVRAARTARKEASQLLEQAKQRVEELILGEEM